MEKRPKGVTILAVLLVILGFVNVITLPAFLIQSQPYSSNEEEALVKNYLSSWEDLDQANYTEFINSQEGKEFLAEIRENSKPPGIGILSIPLAIIKKFIFCIALLLGIGLFLLKDLARKAVVALTATLIPITILLKYIDHRWFLKGMSIITKYDFFRLMKDSDKYSSSQMKMGYKVIPGIGSGLMLTGALVVILIYSFVIYYLIRPKVKRAFKSEWNP